MDELISVLIPAYNSSSYLPYCLDSILSQTYKNLQVIIINDGSTDNTWNICIDYSNKHECIEVYTQENVGVAETRNRLLKHVKGKYILFIDSDDWIEQDMIETLYNNLQNSKSDISICSNVVNNQSCKVDTIITEEWNNERLIHEFLKHEKIDGSLWNKLIKSSLVKDLYFRSDISYGEDALFMWYAIQNAEKVILSNEKLYHYRMNEESLSHQNWTPDKKGSDHFVWEEITNQVAINWPQYQNVSKARFAIQDTLALYYALLCNYKYDEHIKLRQINIKSNLTLIRDTGLATKKIYYLAYFISRNYCTLKKIRFIFKII